MCDAQASYPIKKTPNPPPTPPTPEPPAPPPGPSPAVRGMASGSHMLCWQTRSSALLSPSTSFWRHRAPPSAFRKNGSGHLNLHSHLSNSVKHDVGERCASLQSMQTRLLYLIIFVSGALQVQGELPHASPCTMVPYTPHV